MRVEVAWFRTLAGHEALTGGHALEESALRALDAIVEEFDETQAARVKAIESETNHDVKAVEYYLRERLGQVEGLRAHRELVHFACTSEDISNLAYALMLEEARSTVLLPAAKELIETFRALARRQRGARCWREPMDRRRAPPRSERRWRSSSPGSSAPATRWPMSRSGER